MRKPRFRFKKKKHKKLRIVAFLFVVLFFGSACFLGYVYKSQKPFAKQIKSWVKDIIYTDKTPLPQYSEEISLPGAEEKVLYVNNREQRSEKLDRNKDNKLLEYAGDVMRLIDFATGYYLDLPAGMTPDFSQSPNFSRMNSGFMDVVISRERSPYEDVDEYIAYYLNRFITNEEYRKNNSIELLEDTTRQFGGNTVRLISVKVTDMPEDKKALYTFATINIGGREFFRFLFKAKADYVEMPQAVERALTSFTRIEKTGKPQYDLEYSFQKPAVWSRETRKKFEEIQESKELTWGIFTTQVHEEGIKRTIPELESKLDFTFPVVLIYNHIGQPISQDFLDLCEQQGRTIELTLQMTETNNEDLLCRSPLLETYKGKYDDKIRNLARLLKEEIKTPFFFRLNNEMNTDWANYSGIINLSDPDIYIGCWRRVYEIFEEEQVDNAVWVFNPNDRNYPPCNWNNFLAYFPGEEYVHMIGVTGYNTGTYFKEVTGEDWREFDEIYSEIDKAYSPFFKDYPWIITEFSSSSHGGDKAKWIDAMFQNIKKYPQIKVAVWFSAPDYDPRPGYEGKIGRPYMLDETPATLEAFKRGIHARSKPQ